MNTEEFIEEIKYNLKNTIAIDFDGVIHGNSLGFHDGTIYDEPVQFTSEALKMLSKRFKRIIIYTCKAVPMRPLVNGKTGKELVWEWLRKYDLDKYIYSVTSEKPVAALYIDDNAYRFTNWIDILKTIEKEFSNE